MEGLKRSRNFSPCLKPMGIATKCLRDGQQGADFVFPGDLSAIQAGILSKTFTIKAHMHVCVYSIGHNSISSINPERHVTPLSKNETCSGPAHRSQTVRLGVG
jgi:hypothetical protein